MGSKGGGGETRFQTNPAVLPPHYPFANSFYNDLLPNYAGQAIGFPGRVDPGQSAMSQGAGQLAQAWALSPQEYAQAGQGILGGLMNNPQASVNWQGGQAEQSVNNLMANPWGGSSQMNWPGWAPPAYNPPPHAAPPGPPQDGGGPTYHPNPPGPPDSYSTPPPGGGGGGPAPPPPDGTAHINPILWGGGPPPGAAPGVGYDQNGQPVFADPNAPQNVSGPMGNATFMPGSQEHTAALANYANNAVQQGLSLPPGFEQFFTGGQSGQQMPAGARMGSSDRRAQIAPSPPQVSDPYTQTAQPPLGGPAMTFDQFMQLRNAQAGPEKDPNDPVSRKLYQKYQRQYAKDPQQFGVGGKAWAHMDLPFLEGARAEQKTATPSGMPGINPDILGGSSTGTQQIDLPNYTRPETSIWNAGPNQTGQGNQADNPPSGGPNTNPTGGPLGDPNPQGPPQDPFNPSGGGQNPGNNPWNTAAGTWVMPDVYPRTPIANMGMPNYNPLTVGRMTTQWNPGAFASLFGGWGGNAPVMFDPRGGDIAGNGNQAWGRGWPQQQPTPGGGGPQGNPTPVPPPTGGGPTAPPPPGGSGGPAPDDPNGDGRGGCAPGLVWSPAHNACVFPEVAGGGATSPGLQPRGRDRGVQTRQPNQPALPGAQQTQFNSPVGNAFQTGGAGGIHPGGGGLGTASPVAQPLGPAPMQTGGGGGIHPGGLGQSTSVAQPLGPAPGGLGQSAPVETALGPVPQPFQTGGSGPGGIHPGGGTGGPAIATPSGPSTPPPATGTSPFQTGGGGGIHPGGGGPTGGGVQQPPQFPNQPAPPPHQSSMTVPWASPNPSANQWESGAQNAYDASLRQAQDNIRLGVSDALTQAGFGGNRYSSAAMEAAGEVAGRELNRVNSDFMTNMFRAGENERDRTLQNFTSGLDRQLAATGMDLNNRLSLTQLANQSQNRGLDRMLGMGDLSNQMWNQSDQGWMNRINTLGGLGGQENQRMDHWNMLRYQDFENNKYGTLPLLGGMLPGTSTPQPQTMAYQTPQGPSALDWMSTIGSMIGMIAMASDARLKTDVVEVGRIGELPIVEYTWKATGRRDRGFLAQDVERVAPDAVVEVGGVKHILPARLFHFLGVAA